MKLKNRVTKLLATILVAILVFATRECNAQTITASFAQKIAQYDILGSFTCGLAKVRKDGKYGFIDKAGNEIVPCVYDDVGYLHDHMAWVRKEEFGGFGYVDEMGELVIPCKYTRVQDFSEGLAWVNEDGPWCCINRNGEVVFTLEIMSEDRSEFTDGLSVITPPKEEGTSSIVNTKGEVVTKLMWRSWLGCGISDGLILCERYDEEGYLIGYVYLDTQGNVVIDRPEEDSEYVYGYTPFYNGLAAVLRFSKIDEDADISEGGDVKVGYIDKTGKFAIPISLPCSGYDDQPDFPDPFTCQDDMILSMKQVGECGDEGCDFLYGVVDRTGKLVVPYKYRYIQDFSGGLAAVFSEEEDKFGYIDKTGKVVIPFKYDSVGFDGFQEGLSVVYLGDKPGYVDKQGNDTFSVK